MSEDKGDKNVVADIFGSAAPTSGNIAENVDAGAVEEKQADQPDEKIYAGKFKTPEELEKAYEEAQRWGTQRSQETAALRRELEELRKTAAPDMTAKQKEEFDVYVKKAINAAVVDENPTLLMQLIEKLVEEKADSKIREIAPVIEPIVQERAFKAQVDEFFREYPEAINLSNEMTEIVQRDPTVMMDTHGNIRPDWPYRVYMRAAKGKGEAEAQAAALTKKQTEGMKAAAAAPGTSARAGQQAESEEDKLRKNIFGDANKQRKMFDY